jgi:hypothetical protein
VDKSEVDEDAAVKLARAIRLRQGVAFLIAWKNRATQK